MSVTHEVITIQAGKFSNFIGTHWWNIQESSFYYSPDNLALDINHNVTFKEGQNVNGEVTYTPRLVVIDSQDNYRSLRQECSLNRMDEGCSASNFWAGHVKDVKDEPVKMNLFRRFGNLFLEETEGIDKEQAFIETSCFENVSTVCSDFLKTKIHPNSLCLLNEMSSLDNDNPYELWSSGEEIYNRNRNMFQESIRKMSEDCDYLQGFQLIYDAHDAFAGVNSRILQYLDDEYNRRPSICFPVYQGENIPDLKKQVHRVYAILQSMDSMNSNSTFFSPLCLSDDIVKLSYPCKEFPYLEYNEKLLYHTSAIFAAAIETLSSPYRLRSAKYRMDDIASVLTTCGRKLVSSSIALPFPLSPDEYLSAMVEKEVPEYKMTSLSPYHKPSCERTLYQYAVLRGAPNYRFQNPKKFQYQSQQCDEVFGEYINTYSPSSRTNLTVLAEECCISNPFPKLFKSIASVKGLLNSGNQFNEKGGDKVSVAASFSNSDSAAQVIKDLLCLAKNINFKVLFKFTESTYEKESYAELIENLFVLQNNYTNY